METKSLSGKIALVTGATRGIGKGISLAFAKQGATVYFTGRTENDSDHVLGGSLQSTLQEICQCGGKGYAVKCDHSDDEQTGRVINQIIREQGELNILVNNVWNGYKHYSDGTQFWTEKGFWDAPVSRFDDMFKDGVRAHYETSRQAAPHMIRNGGGIIFNISFWAAERNDKGVAYCMSKAATNKMTEAMAFELKDYHVTVMTIYPGLVRTESVMKSADFFDLSNSESTEFIGMAMAALAMDKDIHKKTGSCHTAAQVAIDYGFTDIDGKQPRPLTVQDI